jgi:hypothetical protein
LGHRRTGVIAAADAAEAAGETNESAAKTTAGARKHFKGETIRGGISKADATAAHKLLVAATLPARRLVADRVDALPDSYFSRLRG